MSRTRKHILLTPGPFFGHYIPMLEFAKYAVLHHDVTIVMGESMVAEIPSRGLVPPKPIQVLSFVDGLTYNLDIEFSVTIMAQVLKDLGPVYKEIVKSLPLQGLAPSAGSLNKPINPVDAVFWDPVLFTVPGACHLRSIPVYALSLLPPPLTANLFMVDENTESVPDRVLQSGADVRTNQSFKMAESLKANHVEANKNVLGCKALLLPAYTGMDSTWEQALGRVTDKFKMPVKFVGPCLPTAPRTDSKLMQWLDFQNERSVVYVSFGSIGKLNSAQLVEIGEALLSLEKPFIWALRKFQHELLPAKLHASEIDSLDASARYLILPWVPQREVLAHRATVVFVSHCGWNSVTEAAFYGVPIVAWGLFADQPANSAWVEKVGLGLRAGQTGLFTNNVINCGQIAKVVRSVAGWDESEKKTFCETAQKMHREAFLAVGPGGTSDRNFKEVMESI